MYFKLLYPFVSLILKFLLNLIAPKAKPEPPIQVQGKRIDLKDIRPGDIILVKGSGKIYQILSLILKVFEPTWDRWGWHNAFVSRPDFICESVAEGVVESPLSKYPADQVRVYRWLDPEPDPAKIALFVSQHVGDQYDILCYLNTAAQYLIRHFWNRMIPRLLDNRYTCWELVFAFVEAMGKPIEADYDCPMITDELKAMGEV